MKNQLALNTRVCKQILTNPEKIRWLSDKVQSRKCRVRFWAEEDGFLTPEKCFSGELKHDFHEIGSNGLKKWHRFELELKFELKSMPLFTF